MDNIAFYIQGNSMTPTVSNGDMVLCSTIDSIEAIEENDIYVIITKAGNVLIKRVQKIRGRNSNIIQLKLIPDNRQNYKTFKIPLKTVK
ncbi:S24/S26 family peptidase, partial [Aureispira]|nr:S24/S26 family peptidase [Aureispira sp.]